MKQRTRYPAEDREMLKQRALALLRQGKSQRNTADDLGISLSTLRTWIKGELYPLRSARLGVPEDRTEIGTNPLINVCIRKERLEAIARMRAALDQEELQLKEELAVWEQKLHKSLFGWHEGDD